MGSAKRRRYRHLRAEQLETRRVLAVVTVQWAADRGATEVRSSDMVAPFASAADDRIDLGNGSGSFTVDAAFAADVVERYGRVAERRLSGGVLESMRQPLTFDELMPAGSAVARALSATHGGTIATPVTALRVQAGAVADAFLESQGRQFGLEQPVAELVPFVVEADQIGVTHVKLQQVYQGVPVYGTGLNVHLAPDGTVNTAGGRLVNEIRVDPTPSILAAEAVDEARALFLERFAVPEGLPVLVRSTTLYVWNGELIDNEGEQASRLVWEIHVSVDGTSGNERFYIDAHSGELVFQVTANRYLQREIRDLDDSGQYRLDYYDTWYDYTFGRSEGQPARGENPTRPRADYKNAVDVTYDMLEDVYDYWAVTFGRNGANNYGGTFGQSALTRVWITDGLTECNWNGSTISIGRDFASPDIIAHEYAHAVDRFDGNAIAMFYSGESGSLEEAWSYVFGEAFEDYLMDGRVDWLDDAGFIWGPSVSFSDPRSSVVSFLTGAPDRYRHPKFFISWPDDDMNIHWNALVPAKAAYLIAEGGSFNGFEIKGLGVDKLSQIWYRAYTEYFVTSENFNGAYHDIIQAARDLYGDAEADEVRKALQATEMHLPRRDKPLPPRVDQVDVSTPPVASLSMHFTRAMNIGPMLAAPAGDGSITSAVGLVNRETGPITLDPAQFAYNATTQTLTWTGAAPLAEGYYELQLRGDLLLDTTSTTMWGGTSGMVFTEAPSVALNQNAILGERGGLFTHTFHASAAVEPGPVVTIDRAAGQADPTNAGPIRFTVVFSSPVSDFDGGDVNFFGSTTPGTLAATVSGSGTSYSVEVSGMTGTGQVVARIPRGVAHDAAANPNLPSTSVDYAVVYDVTPPRAVVTGRGDYGSTSAPSLHFAVGFTEPVTGLLATELDLSGSTASGTLAAHVAGSGTTYDITVTGMTGSGAVFVRIPAGVVQDVAGNVNAAADIREMPLIYDLDGPTVIINRAADQPDPTNVATVHFTAVFSEPVFDFNNGEVDLTSSTAPGSLVATVRRRSLTTYDIAVTGMTGPGEVVARIAAGKAYDVAGGSVFFPQEVTWPGNLNLASTSTDNSVTYDVTVPAVTINQAAGQLDPTNGGPINFTVVFSEVVSDFAAGDVTLSGTAGATTAVVTGSDTTYNVAVSGMARDGTVIASVNAGATHDAAGNPNPASVSNDNSVTYDTTPPALSSLSPLDDVAGVPTDTSLSITFNEGIQKGTGDIVLRRTTDDAVIERIDVAGGTVGVWESTATIMPAVTLAPLTGYYVEVAAGAFADLAGNGFAGLSGATSWNFTTESLRITALVPTASGLVATFNGPLATTALNLYDGTEGTLGPPDVTVLDGTGKVVAGSLVVDDSLRGVEWVATGKVLPPGTYTVSLKSGAAAFRDTAGNALDGDADGTSGGDFSSPLTILASPDRVVSVPDFARGAGQLVNVPNTATGLPIGLDNAAGVTSLAVDLVYDPNLLAITAATLAAGLPVDWTVVNPPDTSTPGVAKIRASGTTPLSGTNVDVVRLTAMVPSDALYGAVQAMRLENVSVNGGTIAAVGDVAVHKAAYLGDADGSGIHSSADAFLSVQAALGLASGFAAHAWTDPLIVGDADGSGMLSAADAFLIVQEGLGLSEPFVPDNPHIGITPVGGGVDPQFRIDVNLPASVGGLVSVPIKLDIDPAATNVGALDFDLFFDPSQLTIHDGIAAGTDTANGWAISSTLIAAGHLRVGMISSGGQPLGTGLREIARLQFRVDAAAPGVTPLDIEPVDPHAGGYTWTAVDGSVASRAGRDQLFADSATELSPLETVLSDLVDDIAAAWS